MESRLAGKYSGQLEKRSRDRGIFAPLRSLTDVHHTGNTWRRREFHLDGQQLSYWQGRTKKGEVCIKDVVVRKLASDEANGKEFGFELTLPYGEPANEKIFLHGKMWKDLSSLRHKSDACTGTFLGRHSRDVFPIQYNATAGLLQETCDGAECGCFSNTVSPHEAGDAA